jgi:L,D-transpeptidase catalytic domain
MPKRPNGKRSSTDCHDQNNPLSSIARRIAVRCWSSGISVPALELIPHRAFGDGRHIAGRICGAEVAAHAVFGLQRGDEMIVRQPYLPDASWLAARPTRSARARSILATVYRIHGTNQPSTIGTFVSSGCIRLTNEDIMDLYNRVRVGTRVVVLPSRPPATAAASSVASSPGHTAQRWIGPGARPASVRDDAVTAPAPARRAVGAHNATPLADSHDGLSDERKTRFNSSRAVAVRTRLSPLLPIMTVPAPTSPAISRRRQASRHPSRSMRSDAPKRGVFF